MVDILSGGRLVLGVGSGYLKHEFEGFRVDPAEKRERFDEALQVLTKALSGERFTFHGKYLTVDDVAINVMPLQTPTRPSISRPCAARAPTTSVARGRR